MDLNTKQEAKVKVASECKMASMPGNFSSAFGKLHRESFEGACRPMIRRGIFEPIRNESSRCALAERLRHKIPKF